jgi:hypothetical protein
MKGEQVARIISRVTPGELGQAHSFFWVLESML